MTAAARQAGLRIGGLTRFTTIDFPGRLACVIHVQGCPLACRYCHSPHLQAPAPGVLPWAECAAWLSSRRGLLDGVVFSGGEPCLQPSLPMALKYCRDLGFATGLHSSGACPKRLRQVIPLLDWVGLDWKGPPGRSSQVTQRQGMDANFQASLAMAIGHGLAYEIRTTYHPSLLDEADLMAMARILAEQGASHWVIQNFTATGCADPDLEPQPQPLPSATLAALQTILPQTSVRR